MSQNSRVSFGLHSGGNLFVHVCVCVCVCTYVCVGLQSGVRGPRELAALVSLFCVSLCVQTFRAYSLFVIYVLVNLGPNSGGNSGMSGGPNG